MLRLLTNNLTGFFFLFLNCNCKLNTSVKWQQPLTGTVDAQERFLSGGILRLRRRAAAQERLRSDHRELAEPVGCRHRPFVDEGPRLCFPVGLCLEDLRRGRDSRHRQKRPILDTVRQIFLSRVTAAATLRATGPQYWRRVAVMIKL